ncbi:MFS transporter [Saccharospirillum salsuginis]|uniref:MFS transporter n=1 Tax=Saccharospirillum salsuginis TaxID=418750 RepID=A0A918K112_9GAMM|nr:MFS transporter [Saccharospirillum salsuginis]GGX40502.1 MFS transporter [Saccharospirillum salsuginis]
MTEQTTHPGEDDSRMLGWLYDRAVGEEDARVCKDIPESACRHLPRNFFGYLVANTLSKVADELSSARLILPWLMGALGAPAAMVGFLVPIREAGVLVPQLMVAAWVRGMSRRKGVWLLGAALSALALLGMGWAAWRLSGASAGWALIGLLVVYSLARGLCSVSAKDVLGKTVSKARRGTVMGYASGISGVVVFGLGIALVALPGLVEDATLLAGLLVVAAVCWGLGLLAFARIREEAGATEGGGNALSVALRQLSIVRTDAAFRRFVWARALLLSVALVPPFYVLLVQQSGGGALGLGGLIIASGLASSVSAPIWGRLSDRSSRSVMMAAAGIVGVLGVVVWLVALLGGDLARNAWVGGALYAVVMVCHGGVRLGRKAYLVDMATQQDRATYVAVSNTLIGGLMLVGGLVGVLGDVWGTMSVIGVLGVVALVAVLQIRRLDDVQS